MLPVNTFLKQNEHEHVIGYARELHNMARRVGYRRICFTHRFDVSTTNYLRNWCLNHFGENNFRITETIVWFNSVEDLVVFKLGCLANMPAGSASIWKEE